MKSRMMKILNNREGQLLVESVIAIGIFTIAIVGIVGVIARAVHEGRTVGNQFIAADLAAEGVEVTKNILDSNALNSGGSTGGAWNAGVQPGIYEVDYTSTSTGPDIGLSLTNLNSLHYLVIVSRRIRLSAIIDRRSGPETVCVNKAYGWVRGLTIS